VLALRDVLRRLEEQMLEQVGEPPPAGPLVLGSDVVHEMDGYYGSGPILVQDDPQTVVQLPFLEVEADFARIGRTGRGRR
jgi:hypothetical protein